MSEKRTILSRPRTKVYDYNYNVGENYYKPMMEELDRKYSTPTSFRTYTFDPPQLSTHRLLRNNPGAKSTNSLLNGTNSLAASTSISSASSSSYERNTFQSEVRSLKKEMEDEIKSFKSSKSPDFTSSSRFKRFGDF